MTCNKKCIHYPICEQKNYDFSNIDECMYYQEERPTGEWLFDTEHSITIDLFKCSVCGSDGHVHFNYCPNCGSKMKEEEALGVRKEGENE